MEQLLADSVIFLAAALIAVPLSVRFGFGSVLGYLVAGAVIGPWGLRLVTDVHSILDISELGIVLMMWLAAGATQASVLEVHGFHLGHTIQVDGGRRVAEAEGR